ncbi:hypothetical protein L6250_03040, partial [Candidatus Parcubacteria bacterium]|nr:hypothetical protein [Candidatus Parcubacteria bacterium]
MKINEQLNLPILQTKNLMKKYPERYQRLSRLLSARKRRQESNKAKYFIPNGKAEKFIKMIGANSTFISLFIAANGVGKTAVGVNIVANICYGVQNEYFNHELFKKFPYMKRGRIISDPTTIKEKIIPELKKWFPENEAKKMPVANYETAKEGKNFEAKFKTNTGFDFDIMSNEQDPKEFESVDLGWIWFDEPPSEAIYKACVGRTRMGAIMFFTLTPLFHCAWVKDNIVDRGKEINSGYVEASVEDACKIHGVRGHLEHKHILQMVSAMSEDEKQARAFGKFGHLIGKVHKKFNRKIHVIRPFAINERDYTVYMALDTHPRVPDHCLWLAVNRRRQMYVCAELLSEGLVKDLVERIKKVESSLFMRIQDRIIEPAAFVDDQHQEQPSVGSILHDKGLFFIKGSKDLMAGIKRTDDAFDYQLIGDEFVKQPEVYVFDTCPIMIKQTEEYVWREWAGKGSDEKKPNPRPRDRNDHQPENLHRLLLHEPQFVYRPLVRNILPEDDDL